MASSSSSPRSILHWFRSSPLGSGSFGSISLAIDLHDGHLFAVKSVACSPDSPTPELLAIENELHFLQTLDSPRILRCFGSDYSAENGSSSRNLFLEYMEGGSIADLVKKSGGKLDDSRVRRYARGILEGLDYLHQQGIVHCDIKGQNVLLGSSGVKLADFGAAKRTGEDEENRGALGQTTDSTPGGSFRGTPLWMAPEVVQGVEQGPPSDIWSLGCTIVEMVQGRPPWANVSNLAALLFQIGCSEKDPPLPDSLSAEGKDFLQKCLQRNPRDRWTSAQLLQHPFVREEVKGDSTKAAPSSPTSTLDFYGHSQWDDDDFLTLNSVPILSLPRRISSSPMKATSQVSMEPICPELACNRVIDFPVLSHNQEGNTSCVDSHSPTEGDWITVRRANGWSQERQKPISGFMLESPSGVGAGRELVHVKKGCDVNLNSLAFLRNRRAKSSEVE